MIEAELITVGDLYWLSSPNELNVYLSKIRPENNFFDKDFNVTISFAIGISGEKILSVPLERLFYTKIEAQVFSALEVFRYFERLFDAERFRISGKTFDDVKCIIDEYMNEYPELLLKYL